VEATVDDRFGGLEVNLEIVEAEVALDDPQPPYTWDLTGLTEGMWTLRVTALDADANAVVEEVVVCIGGDACPLPETTGGMDTTGAAASEDTGDATSTSGTAGGSGTTDDPSGGGINPTSPVPPGLGGSGPGSGCHCAAATDAPAPAAWLLGLLGLLGLTRPRGPYSRRMNVHSPSPVLRSSLIP
jgi:MYXO-CTERM domain-containing protein